VGESPFSIATSDGVTVAVRDGSFLGVQFHPEKSGDAGRRFLEQCLSLV
jgi:imidazoleglycerol phosphate synthase glutamine amidotransferase subunit HisH